MQKCLVNTDTLKFVTSILINVTKLIIEKSQYYHLLCHQSNIKTAGLRYFKSNCSQKMKNLLQNDNVMEKNL